MMPAVLQVFGDLRLLRDGVQVGEPRRKPLALLAILVDSQEPINAELITSLLWPNLDPVRARRARIQTLYALRKEIGRSDAVVGTRSLTISRDLIESDLDDFREAISRSEDIRAIEAYRGPFLDGVFFQGCAGFEQWAEAVRLRYERSFRSAFVRAAKRLQVPLTMPSEVRVLEEALTKCIADDAMVCEWAGVLLRNGEPERAIQIIDAHKNAVIQSELGISSTILDFRSHLAVVTHARKIETTTDAVDVLVDLTNTPHRTPSTKISTAIFSDPAEKSADNQARTHDTLPTSRAFDHIRPLRTTLAAISIMGILAAFQYGPSQGVRGWRVSLGITPSSYWEEAMLLRDNAKRERLNGVDTTKLGRILVLTPSTSSELAHLRHQYRSLLIDIVKGSTLARTVESDQVDRLEEESKQYRYSTSSEAEIAKMMYRASAAVAILPRIVERNGTIHTSFSVYRHPKSVTDSLRPNSFMLELISQNVDPYPIPPTGRWIGQTADAVSKFIRSMETCDPPAHIAVGTAQYCWKAPDQVEYVPGVMAERRKKMDSVRKGSSTLDSLALEFYLSRSAQSKMGHMDNSRDSVNRK